MHFSYTNCEGQSLTAAHLIFSPFLWPKFSRIFWPFSLFMVAVIDNVREVPLFHSPHPPVYIFLCTLLFWFCIFSLSFKYNNLSPSSFAFALELLFIVGCYLLSFTKYCSLRFLLCHHTARSHSSLWPFTCFYAQPPCILETCLSIPMNSWSKTKVQFYLPKDEMGTKSETLLNPKPASYHLARRNEMQFFHLTLPSFILHWIPIAICGSLYILSEGSKQHHFHRKPMLCDVPVKAPI